MPWTYVMRKEKYLHVNLFYTFRIKVYIYALKNKQITTYKSVLLTITKYSNTLWKKVWRETVAHIVKVCLNLPVFSFNVRLCFLAFPESMWNSTDVLFFANRLCYISPLWKFNYFLHQLQKKMWTFKLWKSQINMPHFWTHSTNLGWSQLWPFLQQKITNFTPLPYH